MDSDDAPTSTPAPHWFTPPSTKERNGAQRLVQQLLNELAPERAPARSPAARTVLQRHRTPSSCILQGPETAVSVSWFADSAHETELGELQIIAWRGVVTRRGGGDARERATVLDQKVLRPVEYVGGWGWRTEDGATLDNAGVVASCVELLERHTGA